MSNVVQTVQGSACVCVHAHAFSYASKSLIRKAVRLIS